MNKNGESEREGRAGERGLMRNKRVVDVFVVAVVVVAVVVAVDERK